MYDLPAFYGEAIAKARGVNVRVSLGEFREQPRLDVREWIEDRPGDPDTSRPTQKGANIRVADLPKLLAALKVAEAEVIRAGHLKPTHYQDAGLPVPEDLRPSAA